MISGLIVGIVVVRYQARRTAELTERLRRLERRYQREEKALVELEPMLPTRGQIDHFRSALDSDSGRARAGGLDTDRSVSRVREVDSAASPPIQPAYRKARFEGPLG